MESQQGFFRGSIRGGKMYVQFALQLANEVGEKAPGDSSKVDLFLSPKLWVGGHVFPTFECIRLTVFNVFFKKVTLKELPKKNPSVFGCWWFDARRELWDYDWMSCEKT